ncbi:MAG TPA: glycosyltransferase [Candidatus Sabulitectum sp.]|nr:glycosyltransferase [Candidatus Sabulitectum sp.]
MRILLLRGKEPGNRADMVAEAIRTAGGELEGQPRAAVVMNRESMPDLPPGIPVVWYTEAEHIHENEHMLPGRQNIRIHRWGQGRNRQVIHIPVSPVSDQPEPDRRAMNFLYCGSGQPGSGLKTFLRALEMLPENVKCILQKGAAANETIPEGRLAGGAERTATATVAVLPHLTGNEGGEGAIALMAVGMPVLSTPSGRHRDIVADGISGLYHSPGNHVQLASQMRHIMEDRGLWSYLSANAIERWRAEFSMASAAEGWAGVMEQLRLR